MGFQTLDIDPKTILIGLVVGILLGAGGIYVVNLSKISQLNKEVDALESQVEQLNEVVSNQQVIIDSQEDATQAVEALQNEIHAKDTLIVELENFKEAAEKLMDELVEKYNIVNLVCARQTYRAEKALNLLHGYLPEYEPEYEPAVNFAQVFGDLSFKEWWELYAGPFEEWYSYVYP